MMSFKKAMVPTLRPILALESSLRRTLLQQTFLIFLMSFGTQKALYSDICSNFAVFQFPREDSIFCRFPSGNYARLAAVVVDLWFLWWDLVASGST